jgi:7-keto-8-aminopelargonate synthetase-like enzyme
VASEQKGRKIRVEGKWICDFASCNYLGMDLHPQVIASIPPALDKWGVHPSWTRIVCSPAIYEEVEKGLARLLNASSVLLFQTITLIHEGVIPILARNDSVILMDKAAHRSIYEACRLAHDGGSEFIQIGHNDFSELEQKLAQFQDKPVKLIALDGVYSMSGEYPNLPEYVRLAKKYDATVYIDDAHGFGVVGEKPKSEMPYGYKGNGVVQHYGLRYHEDNIIYVSGLSKAYSSLGAFITCTEGMKELYSTASTYIFSGPCPVASLASTLACLEVNESEGDHLRSQIYHLTHKLITETRAIGLEVDNSTEFPIVTVVVGSPKTVIEACQILWEHGILITPALFPAMPINRGAVRFTITAANTEEEVTQALSALKAVWEMIQRRKKGEQ